MSWNKLRTPALVLAIAALTAASNVAVSMQMGRKTREQVESLKSANEFLRKTLGDLTVAITEKDKELQRRAQPPCAGEQSPPVRSGNGKS
jgi:hypothetical protein